VIEELEKSVPQDFPEIDLQIVALAEQMIGYTPKG
jgi:hypothetical protein